MTEGELLVENQQLRQHIETLYAKIGRLTDLIATMEVQIYGARAARGGASMTGQVINPGQPGWKNGTPA
jgi:hypothetical protein